MRQRTPLQQPKLVLWLPCPAWPTHFTSVLAIPFGPNPSRPRQVRATLALSCCSFLWRSSYVS
ncbi:hypothetical protein FOCG_18348 [Fusarium oxysporum f. sp. radicis-lycopersici 26381]|nr:hypothetical protein FOCG_18348 [Fusarium oxysporum f. sp. radicis-lycopersici 26381]